MEKAKVTELLSNDGSNASGTIIETPPWRESGRGTVAAALDGTGAGVGSTITINGSHDGVHVVPVGTITLSGVGGDTDFLAIDYPWPFLQAVAASAAGTHTKLRVTLAQ